MQKPISCRWKKAADVLHRVFHKKVTLPSGKIKEVKVATNFRGGRIVYEVEGREKSKYSCFWLSMGTSNFSNKAKAISYAKKMLK